MKFTLVNKYGKQVKDQGIKYLQWSLGGDCQDYVSYARGKIVQVFDTQTENIFHQKDYTTEFEENPIKGLATIGKDIFDLRHILIDEKGKLIIDRCSQADSKKSTKELEIKVPT